MHLISVIHTQFPVLRRNGFALYESCKLFRFLFKTFITSMMSTRISLDIIVLSNLQTVLGNMAKDESLLSFVGGKEVVSCELG